MPDSDLSELLSGKSEDLSIEYKAWMDTSGGEARANLEEGERPLSSRGARWIRTRDMDRRTAYHAVRDASPSSSARSPASAVVEENPRCASLEKAQNSAGKDTAIAPLTAAQFHFLQGVYVLNPTMPDGLPPGDGALLLNSRPRRRRADPVDARAACLRTDAGAEEAHRLSSAGEIGRRRQRYVTALLLDVLAQFACLYSALCSLGEVLQVASISSSKG